MRLFLSSHLLNEHKDRSTLSASAGASVFPAHQHQRPWVSDSWTHTRNFTTSPTSMVWTWPEPHYRFCLFSSFVDARLRDFTVCSWDIYMYMCTYVLTHTSIHEYGYMFCSSEGVWHGSLRFRCLQDIQKEGDVRDEKYSLWLSVSIANIWNISPVGKTNDRTGLFSEVHCGLFGGPAEITEWLSSVWLFLFSPVSNNLWLHPWSSATE